MLLSKSFPIVVYYVGTMSCPNCSSKGKDVKKKPDECKPDPNNDVDSNGEGFFPYQMTMY